MASTPESEASEIRRRGRQRLIGAIALVAVLVVFVPMILDSEPRKTPERAELVIPSKDNAPPLPAPPAKAAEPAAAKASEPAPAKAVEPAHAKAPDPAKAAPMPATATVTPAPRDPAPEPSRAVEKGPEKAAKAPAAPAKPTPASATAVAAPKLEGFAVQVGAFRDEAKLDQARQKLGAAKVPHYTERLDAKGGALTRLRAGPFATREAAESALATLKRASLDGKVVPLP